MNPTLALLKILKAENNWKDSLNRSPESFKIRVKSKKTAPIKQEMITNNEWYLEYPALIKQREPKHITKEELQNIVTWKLFRSNKFRPAFMKRVTENSEDFVVETSTKAFEILDNIGQNRYDAVVKAIKSLCKLYGIGFATATAILAPIYDFIPFMSDEIIWFAHYNVQSKKKLVYDHHEFNRVYQFCFEKVQELNKTGNDWTCNKVQETVWACSVDYEYNKELQAIWDKEDLKKKRKRDQKENHQVDNQKNKK
jgi:hypothetical protein